MDLQLNGAGVLSFMLYDVGAAVEIESELAPILLEDGSGVLLLESATLPLQRGEDVYVQVSGSSLWGFVVDNIDVGEITVSKLTYRSLRYTCRSFNSIPARRRKAEAYTDTTSGAIVQDLITDVLTEEGITAGTIETGPTIARKVYDYRPCDEILDDQSELSGLTWRIDVDKALHFEDRGSRSAPFDVTDDNLVFSSIAFRFHRRDYRNAQYIRGGLTDTDSVEEVFVGNGETITFPLGYEISSITAVEVDTGGGYAAATVGILNVDTGKDWYYTVGSNTITQDSGGTVLGATDMLKVTYVGRYPIISFARDDEEIAARAAVESGSGIYEDLFVDEEIDDQGVAFDVALGILRRRGELGTVVTYETFTAGLDVGMLQTITLSEHGFDDQVLIDRVRVTDRGDDNLVYSISGVTNETDGGWAKFFRRLRSTQKAIPRDNEVFNYLRILKETATVSDSASAVSETDATTTIGAADAYVGLFEIG